jgi:tripartite-type tricarboxylate transporter receptor subunit TctC
LLSPLWRAFIVIGGNTFMKKILFFLFLIIPIISNASESITLVVPFPAGGATDTIARVADQMLNDANISSVVLNKPGANNVIGTNFVAE